MTTQRNTGLFQLETQIIWALIGKGIFSDDALRFELVRRAVYHPVMSNAR